MERRCGVAEARRPANEGVVAQASPADSWLILGPTIEQLRLIREKRRGAGWRCDDDVKVDLVDDTSPAHIGRQVDVGDRDEARAVRPASGAHSEHSTCRESRGNLLERARHDEGRQIVANREVVERRQREVLNLQRVAQTVAGVGVDHSVRCRRRPGGAVLDRLEEVVAHHGRVDRVGVLEVSGAYGAVREGVRAVAFAQCVRADIAIPVGRAGNVGEKSAGGRARIETRVVPDDQMLARSNLDRVRQRQIERAPAVGCRVVRTRDEHTRNRRYAVGGEDLRGETGQRRRETHPAGQHVLDLRIPRVRRALVPHVDFYRSASVDVEVGHRARLVDHKIGTNDLHRARYAALPRQVVLEDAVDRLVERPGRGVRKYRPHRVGAVEYDPELNLQLRITRQIRKIEMQVFGVTEVR